MATMSGLNRCLVLVDKMCLCDLYTQLVSNNSSTIWVLLVGDLARLVLGPEECTDPG
jgi:hypothetical protein